MSTIYEIRSDQIPDRTESEIDIAESVAKQYREGNCSDVRLAKELKFWIIKLFEAGKRNQYKSLDAKRTAVSIGGLPGVL